MSHRNDVSEWVIGIRKLAILGLADVEQALTTAVNNLEAAIATPSGAASPAQRLGELVVVVRQSIDGFTRTFGERLSEQDPPFLHAVPERGPTFEVALRGSISVCRQGIEGQGQAVIEYALGFIDGGGVERICETRLSFVTEKLSAAFDLWIDKLEVELAPLVDVASTDEAPDADRQARLQALLSRARSLKIRVRNVPASPSERYLAKLEAKLDDAGALRAQKRQRSLERQQRFDELMAFARQLRIRLKTLPDNPSDSWLDRMEEKLAEAATRKGVAIPQAFSPPTEGATGAAAAMADMAEPSSSASLALDELDDGNPTVVGTIPFPDLESTSQVQSVFASPASLEPLHADPRVLGYLVRGENTDDPTVWPINNEGLRIGRARGNEVQIRDDGGVSRHHASISVADGQLIVRDEGSTRGTLVNDETVTERILSGGDSLQLGDTHFRFTVERPSA